MPTSCAVSTCKNTSRKAKSLSYHRFPKTSQIRKQWIIACKRGESFNTETSRVCSEHFCEDDYVRDLKAELLGYIPRVKVLKELAVPHRNMLQLSTNHGTPTSNSAISVDNETPSPRQHRRVKREIRKRALCHIRDISPKRLKIDFSANTDPVEINCKNCTLLKKENLEDKKSLSAMLLRMKFLEWKNNKLKSKITKLETENKELKINLKTSKKSMQEEIEKICSPVLSKAQIQCLVNKKEKCRWTSEDIAKCLTLRSLSVKAYEYRRKMGEPLPGKTTLARWINSSSCNPGILKVVVNNKQQQKEQNAAETAGEETASLCSVEI